MKEYILVILSGILKAVEKTKWPEEPEIMPASLTEQWAIKEQYERQKREAFEGGALVEFNSMPTELQEHCGFRHSNTLHPSPKDGAYPIDPAKWEVVEQWQFNHSMTGRWEDCGILVKNTCVLEGFPTRLTAIIKPRENIARVQKGQTNGVRNSLNSSGLEIRTAISNPPEPTIATDSTDPIIPEGAHVAVMEPTRKLVTEELIEQFSQQGLSYIELRDKYKKGTPSYESYDLVIREYKKIVESVQSLKAKEIDNIKEAFWQGMRNGRSSEAEEHEKVETALIKNRHEAERLLGLEIEQLKAELDSAKKYIAATETEYAKCQSKLIDLKAELEKLEKDVLFWKDSFAKRTQDFVNAVDLDNKSQEELKQLKESITQEKAKAFDEGFGAGVTGHLQNSQKLT